MYVPILLYLRVEMFGFDENSCYNSSIITEDKYSHVHVVMNLYDIYTCTCIHVHVHVLVRNCYVLSIHVQVGGN